MTFHYYLNRLPLPLPLRSVVFPVLLTSVLTACGVEDTVEGGNDDSALTTQTATATATETDTSQPSTDIPTGDDTFLSSALPCPAGSEVYALTPYAGVARMGSVFSSTLYDPTNSSQNNSSHKPQEIKIKVMNDGVAVAGCEVLWQPEEGVASGWIFPKTKNSNSAGEISSWWVAGTAYKQSVNVLIKRVDGSISKAVITGDAAPHETRSNSIHINWNSPNWDHFSVDVTPVTLPETTYYSAINFPGGYTGLQTDKILFSVWDVNGIDAEIVDSGMATCTGFGGEGTGAKCYLPYTPKTGVKYRFEIEVSYPVSNRTDYTMYFTDDETGPRLRVAQLRYGKQVTPQGASGFIEDWWQTGASCLETEARTAYFENIQYKQGNDTFTKIRSARFSAVYNQWHNEICSNYYFSAEKNRFIWSSGGKALVGDPVNLANNAEGFSTTVSLPLLIESDTDTNAETAIEDGPKPGLQQQVQPAVDYQELLSFYAIAPASEDDLLAALNRASPIQDAGHTYHAQAKWHINWSYTYQRSAGQCSLAGLNVKLNNSILMPRLMTDLSVDRQTRQGFDRYETALLTHEYGHLDFGVLAANEIAKRLPVLKTQENCETMGKTVNALGQDILAQYSVLDDAYDEETGHGRTQGAYLN
ncbi:MAG: DUF922 domain-containing protein [Pseudomonadales bacterium]|nr:DUF922 domain-containing protein [Pseudomonadales bacterium]